jgi:hypothetical protein
MEQIGLLALLALFGLVQLLVRWLRGRAPAPPAPAPPAPGPPLPRREAPQPADEEVVVRVRLPAPPPGPAPIVRVQRGAAEVVARPRRHYATLGTRADLRRAIVLREVLGPCRAMEGSER